MQCATLNVEFCGVVAQVIYLDGCLNRRNALDKLKAASFLLDPNRNLVEANLAAATRVTCAHLNGVLHVHVATLRVCGSLARCMRHAASGTWHAASSTILLLGQRERQ